MAEIVAEYNMTSYWDTDELGFDFNEVESWYIKWNILFVRFSKDENYQKYNQSSIFEDYDCKRPFNISVDGVDINEEI